jgi:hypothetical protein
MQDIRYMAVNNSSVVRFTNSKIRIINKKDTWFYTLCECHFIR